MEPTNRVARLCVSSDSAIKEIVNKLTSRFGEDLVKVNRERRASRGS